MTDPHFIPWMPMHTAITIKTRTMSAVLGVLSTGAHASHFLNGIL